MIKKTPIMLKFVVVFFIAGLAIDVKDYPDKLMGNWQQFIPTVKYIDHIIIGSISSVLIISLLLTYFSFCSLASKEQVKISKFEMNARVYYYLLILNLLIAAIQFVLKTIGFCSFSNYSKMQLIFPPPFFSFCWLIVVFYWFLSERNYLKEVMRR